MARERAAPCEIAALALVFVEGGDWTRLHRSLALAALRVIGGVPESPCRPDKPRRVVLRRPVA